MRRASGATRFSSGVGKLPQELLSSNCAARSLREDSALSPILGVVGVGRISVADDVPAWGNCGWAAWEVQQAAGVGLFGGLGVGALWDIGDQFAVVDGGEGSRFDIGQCVRQEALGFAQLDPAAV